MLPWASGVASTEEMSNVDASAAAGNAVHRRVEEPDVVLRKLAVAPLSDAAAELCLQTQKRELCVESAAQLRHTLKPPPI